MGELQVTCTTKNNAGKITHLGGQGWYQSEKALIPLVKAGLKLFTVANNKRADVGVRGTFPNEYLQTHADGYWNNNLEALSYCSLR